MSFVSTDMAQNPGFFTPGAMVQTDTGPTPAELLRPGARILTRDDGFQNLKWIGARRLSHRTLRDNPDLCPILLRRDALGVGLPLCDMQVSPAQIIVLPQIGDDPAGDDTSRGPIAVAARDLVGRDGVQRLCTLSVLYIHLMFESDATIMVNGVWSDCHQPGRIAPRSDDRQDQHQELLRIFPTLHRRQGRAGTIALSTRTALNTA